MDQKRIDGRLVGVERVAEYDSVFANGYRTTLYVPDGSWREVATAVAPTELGSMRVALRRARERGWV